jgi:hypothetical protein
MEPLTESAPGCTEDALGRDGFAVIEGFLDPDEVATVAAEVEVLLASGRESTCARPNNTLVPLRWDQPAVQLVLASERRGRELRELVAGDDLRWISGYVSVKDAHSLPLDWHRDWWCWDHPVSYRRRAAQVAVLCYLADADASNGGLRVLPGSHHRSAPAPGALADDPDQVTLRLRAGDAAVIDYRLLHGTHANVTAARRDCLLLSFTPSWRGLPANVRAHLVRHPAQPDRDEHARAPSWAAALLPHFDGVPADLPLNRVPPAQFEMID